GSLVDRGSRGAFLGVVHEDRALRDAVGDDRTRGDHTIAVVGLDPVVVLHADLRRILIRHPNDLATAGDGQQVQVVVVLRVDRPLVVRGEVADGHLGLTIAAG